MIRGLVLGGVAFAVAFALERQFETIRKDLARYDRLNEMSGEPPFLRKIAQSALSAISEYGASQQGKAENFLQTVQSDALRYARLRGM
jgi:hypothetical protein